jgi:biopolymer transport protein TolQ
MSNPLWQSFKESGLVGQGILIILFIASIVVWTIIVHKLILLRQAGRAAQSFLNRFSRVKKGLFSLSSPSHSPEIDPVYAVYQKGCRELSARMNNPGLRNQLDPEQREQIQLEMKREAENQVLSLEQNLIFLATAAATGPLLGILGTIWGVLVAFRGMGQFGAATIDAVAPGISEALVTTVAGLVVAIPALIFYNYFHHVIGRFSRRLDNFISDFLAAASICISENDSKSPKTEIKRHNLQT